MAVCEYCGTTYRGGAAVHGKHRFCTNQCRDRGRILELLDAFPTAAIEKEIEKEHAGPCPECGARANIDIHKSHKVYSAFVWTSWKTQSHICCQSCGRKHQLKAIAYSGSLGWWGVPFGLIITPVQLLRNVAGMLRRADRPSNDFARTMRVHLAERVAAARTRQA
jgi:hypothetical protein